MQTSSDVTTPGGPMHREMQREMNGEINPQTYARVGGFLYLTMIVLGIIDEAFIRGRIMAGADAAATFANLQKMEMLWRTGIAIELVMMIISVALAVILYVLTKPVQKELALLGLLFNCIGVAVESAYSIQLVEALFPLGRGAYLTAFTPGQLQAMTTLAMKGHVFGFGIALLLFGPYFLVTGYLVFTSGYLPKPVGVLYQIAGVAYLVNGFALVLAPQFAGRMFTIIAGPAFIGETSFALWLLFKGVRIERWRSLTGASAVA